MWYVIRYLRQKRLREHQRRKGGGDARRPGGLRLPAAQLGMAVWTHGTPFIACAVLGLVHFSPWNWWLAAVVAATLAAVVLVSVHHAEVVAHRVGEPFGTLILALAITIIESGLIVSIMLSANVNNAANAGNAALARDAVYATVMIACNGGIGLCLVVGALRHFVLSIRVEGASPALSVLIALTTLTLILPALTTTSAGPTFSRSQLMFAGAMSLVLYCVFVFVQTVRHRDYFLPVETGSHVHAVPPAVRVALRSLFLLCVSLAAVVGLAKALAPAVRQTVTAMAAPNAVVGVVIALLVLMPETWAAMRAAVRNRMQTSVNLLLGSALATIGLTIPVVAVISLMYGMPLQLGLAPTEIALLVLTFFISTITLAGGRATVLHGAVHLVLFATFLFLSVVP